MALTRDWVGYYHGYISKPSLVQFRIAHWRKAHFLWSNIIWPENAMRHFRFSMSMYGTEWLWVGTCFSAWSINLKSVKKVWITRRTVISTWKYIYISRKYMYVYLSRFQINICLHVYKYLYVGMKLNFYSFWKSFLPMNETNFTELFKICGIVQGGL